MHFVSGICQKKVFKYLLDCLDHGKTHVHAEDRMVGSLPRRTTDAVVTVSQDLDTKLIVPL